MEKMNVKPAEGKLGILVVGCGAVATTFMTGVFMTRKGLAKPVGSMLSTTRFVLARVQTRNICTTRTSFLLQTLMISYSVLGMFIRRMLIRQLCMLRY